MKKRRGHAVLADKAYSGHDLRNELKSKGIKIVIPRKSNEKLTSAGRSVLDSNACRNRNVVERCFGRLKEYRRIATRYDKTARNYLAMVKLGCIRLFYQRLCNKGHSLVSKVNNAAMERKILVPDGWHQHRRAERVGYVARAANEGLVYTLLVSVGSTIYQEIFSKKKPFLKKTIRKGHKQPIPRKQKNSDKLPQRETHIYRYRVNNHTLTEHILNYILLRQVAKFYIKIFYDKILIFGSILCGSWSLSVCKW
jgi:transposase